MRIKHGCTSAWRVFNGDWVTNKGESAFPSANNCQGQLQTPQSVSVLPTTAVKCKHTMICQHLYLLFTAIICAERSDIETRFSPRTSVFTCQKHSSTAPYSFFTLLRSSPSLFSACQALRSIVDLGVQYSPHSFPSPATSCQMIIFSMSPNPLHPHQSHHFVIFLFSLFRPLWLSLLFFGILSLFVLSIFPHHLNPNSAVSAPCYLLGCSASPAFLSYETTHTFLTTPPSNSLLTFIHRRCYNILSKWQRR